jgi:hypothetical protein
MDRRIGLNLTEATGALVLIYSSSPVSAVVGCARIKYLAVTRFSGRRAPRHPGGVPSLSLSLHQTPIDTLSQNENKYGTYYLPSPLPRT